MSDRSTTLAEEYWAHYLEDEPDRARTCSVTTAVPAEFEEATARGRGPRDRRAARLRAPGGGDRRGAASTSSSGSPAPCWSPDATTRADLLEARLAELGSGPDLRPAGLDADPDGHARAARRRGRRGAGRQARAGSAATTASSPSGSARAWPRPRPRRIRGRATRSRSSTGCCPTPVADDPLLHDDAAARRPRRRRLEGPAACGDRVRRASRHGGLPRRAARRGAARRPGPTSSAACSWLPDGDAAYAATLRYFTTTDEDRPGDPRHRARADREARRRVPQRSAPRWSAPTTSTQIFEAMRTDPKLHFSQRRRAGRGLRGRDAARLGRDAGLVRGAPAGAVRRAGAR